MTLLELSAQYRHHAQALQERYDLVNGQLEDCHDPNARCTLADRRRILGAMLRETRELAVLTERYYERGYRRNGKYTI